MSQKQYIQTSVTIQNLQNYITQLTLYINENNTKYTKNLQTLKKFYEDQISQQNNKLSILQDQKLMMKNQLIFVKDLLLNREFELKQLRQKNIQYKQQNQQYHQKLNKQRKQIDLLYEQITQLKQKQQKQLNSYEQKYKQIQNDKNSFILILKQKQQQISTYKKQVNKLQLQVSQRYSLPQKLHDTQLQSTKNKTLVISLTQTKKQLQKKIDYLNNDIEKIIKENQKLKISNDTLKSTSKLELNQQLNKKQKIYNQKMRRLQSSNEKQLFEITQLQNSLKFLKQQSTQLQSKLSEYSSQINTLKSIISSHDNQKNKYIEQFRQLKLQYQGVINNLQESIPIYQKKFLIYKNKIKIQIISWIC